MTPSSSPPHEGEKYSDRWQIDVLLTVLRRGSMKPPHMREVADRLERIDGIKIDKLRQTIESLRQDADALKAAETERAKDTAGVSEGLAG